MSLLDLQKRETSMNTVCQAYMCGHALDERFRRLRARGTTIATATLQSPRPANAGAYRTTASTGKEAPDPYVPWRRAGRAANALNGGLISTARRCPSAARGQEQAGGAKPRPLSASRP
jgi:hypothetical protein